MGLVKHKKLSKTEYNSLSEKDEDTLYAVNENGDFSESNMDDSAELYIGDKKIGGGGTYDLATESTDGLMSADDKKKTNTITVDATKKSVAIGYDNTNTGNNGFVIGNSNSVTHNNSVALGQGLKSGAQNQTILGKFNVAYSTDIFAIGQGTSDTDRKTTFNIDTSGRINNFTNANFKVFSGSSAGNYSVAMGQSCTANGTNSVAMGKNSKTAVLTGNETYPYGYMVRTSTTVFKVENKTVYGAFIPKGETITYTYNGTEYTATNNLTAASALILVSDPNNIFYKQSRQTSIGLIADNYAVTLCTIRSSTLLENNVYALLVQLDNNNVKEKFGNFVVLWSKTSAGIYGNGQYSLAVGSNTYATGSSSCSFGDNCVVSAQGGFASGRYNYVAGMGSCAIGTYSIVTGGSAVSLGGGNVVGSQGACALGQYNNVNGSNSVALGRSLLIETASQTVVGKYNAKDTSAMFIIGNGTSNTDRLNIFTVSNQGVVTASSFKGDLQGTATKVGHSLTITNGANSVVFDGSENKTMDIQTLISGDSMAKFSRIEYNEIESSNIVQGSTSLNGEIVYIDNLHPLSDGFYWYATDGKYYRWWNTAHLFKNDSTFVTLPNKIFECGEDGQQYVFLPTSYNDDGTAKYGQLLKLTDTKMLNVTYSELKNLKDNAKLIKGMQYRITDFVTTCNNSGSVSGVNTSSAGHPFDIIVTADDDNTLNANARVCLHKGDTYFANNKLSEWVIKYDINNVIFNHQWADEDRGKGVIYYMRDEFGNEAPYDFKNIRFNGIYTFNYSYNTSQHIDFSLRGYLCYENIIQGYYDGNKLILNNITHMSNNLDNGYIRNNTYGTNCHSNSLNGNCNGNKFGNNCTNNLFYNNVNFISLGDNCSHNTINRYIYYVNLGVYCSYITLNGETTTDSYNRVRYVDILKGVFGTEDNPLTISLPVNTTHQTTVAKNSAGVIKIYNEADLVP